MRNARVAWRSLPVLPVILIALPLLDLYVGSGVSVAAVVRTLAVAALAAVVAQIVSSAVLGDRHKGALAAILLILALYGWPHAADLSGASVVLVIVLGALLVVLVSVVPRVTRTAFPWPMLTPAGNALGLVFLTVTVLPAAADGTLSALPRDVADTLGTSQMAPTTQARADQPDIFLIMPEDYPRADVLGRLFAFDNGEFVAGLKDRGFVVADRARSNYSTSVLTLLTMFQARHIEAIPELEPLLGHETTRHHRLLRSLTNDGVAFDVLKDAGYDVIAPSSGFEQMAMRGVERFIDTGQINDFEVAALRETALTDVAEAVSADVLGDQLRARVRAQLALLPALASEDAAGPRFVFVHLPTPHAPIVFGPSGEPIAASLDNPWEFDFDDVDAFRRAYVGQLSHVNGLILEAIDGLPRSGRPSVTIVLSDEGGSVAGLDPDPASKAVGRVAILFAARAPDGGALFPPWVTPVNLFPILFERYLGVNLPHQSDRNFISGTNSPFVGTELANLDAEAAD
jgi:hypothetical protein